MLYHSCVRTVVLFRTLNGKKTFQDQDDMALADRDHTEELSSTFYGDTVDSRLDNDISFGTGVH